MTATVIATTAALVAIADPLGHEAYDQIPPRFTAAGFLELSSGHVDPERTK